MSFYSKEKIEQENYANRITYREVFIGYYPKNKENESINIIKIILNQDGDNKAGFIENELEKILRILRDKNGNDGAKESIWKTPSLEEIIKQNKENFFSSGLKIHHYYKEDKIINTNGAEVIPVPLYSLPHGNGWQVYGMYDPSTHIIYVANDIDPLAKQWILYHEAGHAKGIPGTIDGEARADAYATAKMGGYNPFPNRVAGNINYN